MPVTPQASEQEEDSSQEEDNFQTPNKTLSSIPDQTWPDGDILGGLDFDDLPTTGNTPVRIRTPKVTSTPETSTQPLPATSSTLAYGPLMFPDPWKNQILTSRMIGTISWYPLPLWSILLPKFNLLLI